MSRSHQLKEYIKYRRKAKSRHGVHSPFVYELAEKLLKKDSDSDNLILATSKHKKLVNKLIRYFGCRNILWITNKNGEAETFIGIEKEGDNKIRLRTERFSFAAYHQYPDPDIILIDLPDPDDWSVAWEKYSSYLKGNSIILILSIHQSKKHTTVWNEIYANASVKLSLDLYRAGLLFFREAFLEKQHFVLKT